MRSGTCAAQQTLTPEAASVLKHSLSLAARRGHSHVTPLHVASTLLSNNSKPPTLLRRACLKSHPPHPLQSRALELCFNVALNRLPSSPPLLHSPPSLSNALIAALKRAQAHQRRGSSSSSSLDHHHQQQQQHPLLTVKVELQHLIISILDDPSVSRVMREAGFSSTAVKTNIEEYNDNNNNNTIFISPPSPISSHFFSPQTNTYTPFFFSSSPPPPPTTDATKLVFEAFLGKNNNNLRTNVVVVGDSVGLTEGVVFEVMRKVKMGEVPEVMKGVKFVEFLPLMKGSSSLKLGEYVKDNGDGGVLVYVGDLKWIVEGGNSDEIERLVGEIERLLKGDFLNTNNNGSKAKIWVMGMASYQIYMRCQMRQPALETQWSLHAVPVPSSGLGLTLHTSSVYDSRPSFFSQTRETKQFIAKEEHEKLTCCAECTSNFENEVQHLKSFQSKQVPSWLQQYNVNQSHSKDEFVELRKKWNRFCSSLHRDGSAQSLMGKSFSYCSSYPWWPKFDESNSISFTDNQTPKPLQSSNLVPRFRRQQSCTTIEFDFGNATTKQSQDRESPSLNSLKHMVGKEVKITLALGNPLFYDSSAESMEMESERKTERGEILKVLQENVPWQSESLPSIAEAVISAKKNEKRIQWILMEGNDFIGKRKMALAIAESVFGSIEFFLNLNAKSEEMGISRSEMVEKALKSTRELVILVEDVEMADSQFMKFLEDGFESGKFGEVKEERIEKLIFVLTKDDSSDKKKNRDSSSSVIEMTLEIDAREKHKRKAEREIENKSKKARINKNRQSSINNNNTIDLNLKAANEEDQKQEQDDAETNQTLPNGQISPISSDLTRETTMYNLKPANGFMESISNRFLLKSKSTQESEIREQLRRIMTGAYEENCKKWKWDWDWDWNWDCRFRVEEGVLEGILEGFGSFSNKVFEKWVNEIFQTSLEGGRYGGKQEGGIDIRLCLDQKHILEEEHEEHEEGYMGSCLPKKIKLSSMD
ncbi:protein SMAX1-LIKE 4-like [Cucurbita pepo subsp. pepo]|uniref:protein SMAX1-LIKE 4-like n=1 Tax=Cucurbita pepo subsp. pepo TaxID=3664 RepID=UPI000C9D76F0|nr:protein SMAX1-LIKE 4-like [Cucurbita pepo subsp. pepo]